MRNTNRIEHTASAGGRERTKNPAVVAEAWKLRKASRLARCTLLTHLRGWELRLSVGTLCRSDICKSPDRVMETAIRWYAMMRNRGWVDA